MHKKILITVIAALLLLLTTISAVNAYSVYPGDYPIIYPDLQPVSPNYLYYRGYESIPTLTGPYPRYYLGYNNYNGRDFEFAHDDFNHFDTFEGYRDLDVFYPARGYVDVIRNPSASISPAEVDPSVPLDAEPTHVYGYLPNGGIYKKHYYHDHTQEYCYGGCAYYFTPIVAYRKTPTTGRSCMPRSICDATHETCCN